MNPEVAKFNKEDTEMLEQVAKQISIALEDLNRVSDLPKEMGYKEEALVRLFNMTPVSVSLYTRELNEVFTMGVELDRIVELQGMLQRIFGSKNYIVYTDNEPNYEIAESIFTSSEIRLFKGDEPVLNMDSVENIKALYANLEKHKE